MCALVCLFSMVNVFGEEFKGWIGGGDGGGEFTGKRGHDGENSGYFAQYFQHLTTTWDVDWEASFWIDSYDV